MLHNICQDYYMNSKFIQIKNLTLSFHPRVCFEDFSTQISHDSRIAIIGRNGSGKSTLLKILNGEIKPTEGHIKMPDGIRMSYVPQVIEHFDALSGGQRFNKALSTALSTRPNLLLLDEPTNHLDSTNRKSLMQMLQARSDAFIVVSHDVELLRTCIDTIWHIEHGVINIFTGNYNDYMRQRQLERSSAEHQKRALNVQKKNLDNRICSSSPTAGRFTQKELSAARGEMNAKIADLEQSKTVVPTFTLTASDIRDKEILHIFNGAISYTHVKKAIVRNIQLSLRSQSHIAILGDNGTGKSTLFKAILNNPSVIKGGEWTMPESLEIGHLDQHYSVLCPEDTVFDSIAKLVPTWAYENVRKHLATFLFRDNTSHLVKMLSGGEKARLSIAQITAKTPRLLLLDEITNNIDLETRAHVIEAIKEYPGAIIVISHDNDFLKTIKVDKSYKVLNGEFVQV